MFGVGDAPDLWPGACDTRHALALKNDRQNAFDSDPGTSTTSSSAAAARKAALVAANATATASTREGVEESQYVPNSGVDVRPNPELHAKLLKIEPTVAVLRRNDQLVRRVGLVASDGKTYRFLLQFAIPYWTRTDERTSQVNYVLDKVLRRELRTCKANLSVQPHPVIPVAQRLRLISEPDTRNSLEDIYRTFCERHGKAHSVVTRQFADTIKQELDEKITPSMSDSDRQDVEKSVRLEVFNSVLSAGEVPENILTNHLSNVLKGPEPLFQFRLVFAQQWAANCLLQYAFSVAERTPNRVVVMENCGRVLSPDFRISYSSQGFIEGQSVPFRLSPNIINLIGFPLLDARFTRSMVEIAGAVRARRDELDPIFRLLMRDDLVAFFTKSMAKSDAKTQEMEKQLVDRIGRNAASVHTRMLSVLWTSAMPRRRRQILWTNEFVI